MHTQTVRRWGRIAIGRGLVCLAAAAGPAARAQSTAPPAPSANATLTAVDGVKVGQHTQPNGTTGCTAILVEGGATGGVDVRGGAPGTRETSLLAPLNTVQQVHAVTLSGGSAFGLDAASGVMRYLDEKQVGLKVGAAIVPIVPAAVLIDLWVGDNVKHHPDADCGYEAARAATTAPVIEGNIGAGAGATIGKSAGVGRAMKGGLGSAAITTPDGITVAAIVAVNARGDVIDPATGRVLAGVRTADGKGLADARRLLRGSRALLAPAGGSSGSSGMEENTTIGVIATNARLTKAQATKVAQMAHDGYARAIWPVHTPVDGDTVFTIATGTRAGEPDVLTLGALAADVMAEAIVRAVRAAASLPGLPGLKDWQPAPPAPSPSSSRSGSPLPSPSPLSSPRTIR